MIVDDLFEAPQPCPECGGVSFSDLILAEKKDACYYKVKASAKVWPSAYASGRLVQCRKKGADNYGNKSEGVAEGSRTPQDWEVKSAVWGLDKRGVHQEPQNIKSHFVRADRSSRAEEKAKREYEPGRGTWEIHPRGNKQQGVAEGFDQPYPLKWEKSDYGGMDALAKLPDGSPLSIMFSRDEMSENDWGLEFYRNNSQSVTGEGDAYRVFATVLNAISQFIKKKKPDTLFFSTVKEEDPTGSRAKLYDRLVQKYATGSGYDLKKVDYPEQTGYKLTRKEQGVAEKLGDNRPKLGSKRDSGKSIRKWRSARGLDETDVVEGLGSGVDAKGRTQQQWIRLVKAKYPDARIMQSKMIDGPCQAMLSDGRKLSWIKVDNQSTEIDEASWNPTTGGDYPVDYTGREMVTGPSDQKWQAAIDYYTNDIDVKRALQDLANKNSRMGAQQYVATFAYQIANRDETRYFKSKSEAYEYARISGHKLTSIEKLDNDEVTPPVTYNVILGIKEHRRMFKLTFASDELAQKWAHDNQDVVKIQWNDERGQYSPPTTPRAPDTYGGKIPGDETGVAEGDLNEKSTSQAQFRTMAAAAHNPEFAKKVGIKQSVAKEFHGADRGQNYKKLPDRTTEGSLKETDTSRRGFLRGLAAFAASAAVPAPVVKLLSTPAGVASLPIPAGIALLKGIQKHLDQWDPEDDDDYYEAWEDMAGELGFEDEDAGDEYGESAQDQLADIVNLYRENPELAAAQLIKHLQTNVGVSAKEINPSFASRADNPNDWRYHDKQQGATGTSKKDAELANLTRLAAAAQSAANARLQQSAAAATVKHMGPVQYAKDIPALPAPTKPEFDLAPDLKQKEKVPVSQQYKKDNQQGMGEGEQQKGADYRDPPEADYGDDYQAMVARVKKLAGLGPLKTVYDPNKRVYRNMPTAVQPKK